MTKGKLYGGAKNFRTQKVLIAAKLGKTEVEVQSAHPPADKFPFGQTPAFEDSQTTLFGADAIAAYVGKMDISAAVAQWLTWAEGSLLPNVLGYVLPSISVAALDQKIKNAVSKQDIPLEVVNSYKNELLAQLNVLDKMLLSKTFLVGERLSLADISVALDLLPAFQNVLDGAFRKSHVNLTRWFLTIVNQSAAKEVLGDVKLAEKISHFSESEFKKNSENLGHSVAKKEEKHHGHHG